MRTYCAQVEDDRPAAELVDIKAMQGSGMNAFVKRYAPAHRQLCAQSDVQFDNACWPTLAWPCRGKTVITYLSPQLLVYTMQQAADALDAGVNTWLSLQKVLPDFVHQCRKAHVR